MRKLLYFFLSLPAALALIIATSATAAASQPTYTCYFYRTPYTYSATHKEVKAYEKSSIYFKCQRNF